MKIKKTIFLILIIINCITIFNFSSQKADLSRNTSGRVANLIIKTFPSLNSKSEEEKLYIANEVLQPVVRKLAHYLIYTSLGFWTMNYAMCFKGTNKQKGITSWVFGTLYAASDEIHQLFIEGRSGEIKDACLDSLGVITGILIALLLIMILRKIFKIKKEKFEINKNTKILFISSTGGHFSELMQLKPIMDKCTKHIVTENTFGNYDLKNKYKKEISFLVYETKKRPLRYIFVLLINCFISLYIYLKFRPQMIITTGTHTAIPMCFIGKTLGSKVIYIETFANKLSKTQTGKLIYYIADLFIVQWEEMLKLYPKAKCLGAIY